MGRKSTKENKSIYQEYREENGLTRAKAAEIMSFSESSLEKIESGKQLANPDDIVLMADAYRKPELCNHYCSTECPIGMRYVPKVECVHDLPQIAMELLSKINSLSKEKDRIIDIAADGKVSEDESKDFQTFRNHLSEMALAIETLRLWADKELERNV